MLTWEDRKWRSVVKEVQKTVEYPGYKYIYFDHSSDADRYFTDLLGPNWRDQDWAKTFLRRSEKAQFRQDQQRWAHSFDQNVIDNNRIVNAYISDSNNYEYMVKIYVTKNNLIDVEKIVELLKSKNYRPDYNKVRAYINKYHKTARQENPDRNTIIEFIKYYHGQGLSLRKIEQALAKDDITITYRQIGTILKELEDAEQSV